MSPQAAEQFTFDFVPQLPVVVQRSAGQISSDAGLLPLRQFDQRWDYTGRMARCLEDPRPTPEQTLPMMLRQRLFGILAGYEDCNDHDTLRDDPVFKLIADRFPKDKALASQPTLSRFENLPTPAVLQRLIDFLIDTGIERLKFKHGGTLPASITLDLDATDDPTHGHQQLTLFHGYYGQYQYYPLIISEPTTKHVFIARLKRLTEDLMLRAKGQYEQTQEKARLFECFDYQCDTWPHSRRVVAKAECHDGGTNLRFIVTNLPEVHTCDEGQKTYDHYVQRGESEHRMDELKNGLHMDRLSCHRFMANFFRLLLHTAAMNLLNAVRDHPDLPQVLRVGQPCTWQLMLIKVAARIVQSTRRVVVELAGQWPWWPMYQSVAGRALSFTSSP